jgi:hypothetical protein
MYPGLESWDILSRPCGTGLAPSSPGLLAPEGILLSGHRKIYYQGIGEFRGRKKRTSAAKAVNSSVIYGTAEAVPSSRDSK